MSAQAPKLLPPEVIAALQRGQLVEAIRLLRSAGNIDLKQAKQAIEQHLDRSKVAKATVGAVFGSLLQIPGDGAHPQPPKQQPAWQPTLSRRGLSPGEEPQTVWSRWWIVALIILGALTYYFYTRG